MAEGLSDFVIVSGLSGAGRTTAIKALEDIGFYAVDNLPVALLESFYRYCLDSSMGRVAVGIHTKTKEDVGVFEEAFKKITRDNGVFLLFLEAEKGILLKRFRETRRFHPLRGKSIVEAIIREKELLAPVKELAHKVVDTTDMNSYALRRCIFDLFRGLVDGRFRVSLTTFGFKKGMPSYVDMLFDVRGLPNPYYEEDLRDLDGRDEKVFSYVFSTAEAEKFFSSLLAFVVEALESLKGDGRLSINIGVGCTGGRHRSVAVAERLGDALRRKGYRVSLFHRELGEYKDLLP